MFETDDHAKYYIPELSSKGQNWWNYVGLVALDPWFLIGYKSTENGGFDQHHVRLIGHVDHLLGLSRDARVEIQQVDLVSNAKMNKTGKWIMESVSEILSGKEPVSLAEQTAYIFQLENNNRYVFSIHATPEHKLIDVHSIFKI